MKFNEWVNNIKRLRINRLNVKEYKRLDFAEEQKILIISFLKIL